MRPVTKPLRLRDYDRERIRAHLLRLSLTDRYLRFCSALSDSAINRYVDGLELSGKDAVYGIYDSDVILAGMIHVAPVSADSVEFALSVDDTMRKRGIGDMLFERGLLHCESVGITRVYMNCLSTNEAIKKMARRRNMSMVTDYGETVASLDLGDITKTVAWLETQHSDRIGLYDLRCLPHRQAWEDYITEVKRHVAGQLSNRSVSQSDQTRQGD